MMRRKLPPSSSDSNSCTDFKWLQPLMILLTNSCPDLLTQITLQVIRSACPYSAGTAGFPAPKRLISRPGPGG